MGCFPCPPPPGGAGPHTEATGDTSAMRLAWAAPRLPRSPRAPVPRRPRPGLRPLQDTGGLSPRPPPPPPQPATQPGSGPLEAEPRRGPGSGRGRNHSFLVRKQKQNPSHFLPLRITTRESKHELRVFLQAVLWS